MMRLRVTTEGAATVLMLLSGAALLAASVITIANGVILTGIVGLVVFTAVLAVVISEKLKDWGTLTPKDRK